MILFGDENIPWNQVNIKYGDLLALSDDFNGYDFLGYLFYLLITYVKQNVVDWSGDQREREHQNCKDENLLQNQYDAN